MKAIKTKEQLDLRTALMGAVKGRENKVLETVRFTVEISSRYTTFSHVAKTNWFPGQKQKEHRQLGGKAHSRG